MELKPCPFCGGEEIDVKSRYQRTKGCPIEHIESYCVCSSCGIGAHEETEAEAIEAWNRRA
jgi:Lar family restriction alleviation protein